MTKEDIFGKSMYERYLQSIQHLSAENQKLLFDFLLTILSDTSYLEVKCLASHHDKYLEIIEKFEELGLRGIREDWNLGDRDYTIVIEFKGLLGCLIEFDNIHLEVENND